jgi:IS5 family transposase
MARKSSHFRVAIRPGKRRALAETAEGKRQDLIETAKAYICLKDPNPFRVIKQQFGFQKTRQRGMVMNCSKMNVLAALTNLFLKRRQLLASPQTRRHMPQRFHSWVEFSQKGA